MQSTKQDYRNEMDSVRAFVHDGLVRSDNPDHRIKYSRLYELYKPILPSLKEEKILKRSRGLKRL